ncbi:MAG: hypothetical protein ABWY20_22020 [Mycobacterium sp.]
MTAPWRRVAMAVLALSLLAGCSSEPAVAPPQSPPSYPNWPESLADFRFRWTAEPGVDLLTGPAVPLRAFLESFRVGDFTKDLDGPDPGFSSYPGFLDAVTRPTGVEGPIPFQITHAWPFPGSNSADEPSYGNEYFHVLKLDPIDGGYRAYVCDGQYNVLRRDRKTPKYVSILGSSDRYSVAKVWRVELRGPVPAGPGAVPQQGPNPAPIDDVFGDGQITASDHGVWGMSGSLESRSAGPIANELHARCLGLMPHSPAEQVALADSEHDSPPTAEPAVPGWPASAS